MAHPKHPKTGVPVVPGDIIESEHRPAAFVPDPADIAKAKQVGPQALDMTGYEGEWYKLDEPPDKEGNYAPYGQKLVPDDPYQQTVHMKNQDHYWAGTAEQAKQMFSQTPPNKQAGAGEPAAV